MLPNLMAGKVKRPQAITVWCRWLFIWTGPWRRTVAKSGERDILPTPH